MIDQNSPTPGVLWLKFHHRAMIAGTSMYALKTSWKFLLQRNVQKIIDTFLQTTQLGWTPLDVGGTNNQRPDCACGGTNHENAGSRRRIWIWLLFSQILLIIYLHPTATVVQHKLQATRAGTFDINTACAGCCRSGYRVEIHHGWFRVWKHFGCWRLWNVKILEFWWFQNTTLFADGAGAAIVRPRKDNSGILANELYTDGQYRWLHGIYGGGTYRPITHEVLEKKVIFLISQKIPIETNGTHWPRLTNTLLDRLHKTSRHQSFFHDSNQYQQHQKLWINWDYLLEIPQYHGSLWFTQEIAAIGMAIADTCSQKKLKKGDLVFLLGSGGGLSMAAMAMEWGYDT